jgi:hypothetical protein
MHVSHVCFPDGYFGASEATFQSADRHARDPKAGRPHPVLWKGSKMHSLCAQRFTLQNLALIPVIAVSGTLLRLK